MADSDSKNVLIIGYILVLFSVFYSLYSIQFFKLFYRDSIWVASYAYNYVKEGYLLDVMAREVGMALGHGRVHDILYGNFMILLDGVVSSERYLSWIISLIALSLFYSITTSLGYDKKSALYSVLFLSITEHFLLAAHIARTDMLAFTSVLLVVYLIQRWNERKILVIFAGCIAAVAIDIHLSTQYVLFLLIALELGQGRITKENLKILVRKYEYFIVGYFFGLGVVVFNNYEHIHTLVLAFDLLQERAIGTSFIDRISWIVSFALNSTYYRWLFYPVLIVVTLYLYVREERKKGPVRVSMYMFVGGYAGYLILGRMNHHYIMIFMAFLYQALVYYALVEKNKIAISFMSLSVAMFIAIQSFVFIRDGGADFEKYVGKVDAAITVAEDVVVIAPDDLWWVFRKNQFHGYHTRSDIEDLVNNNKVLFVSNEVHRRFIDNGEGLGKSTGVNRYGEKFLAKFMKVSEVADEHYGGFGITKNNIITLYANYEK